MAKSDKPALVVLVAPDGGETTVSDPAAVNNLIYGAGYRPKSGTVEAAVEAVTPTAEQPAGATKKAGTA